MSSDPVALLSQQVHKAGHFIQLLLTRFVQDQGLAHAASLTFTSLLSLVPLMTVSLAIFAAFPVAEQVSDTIQDFIFRNFVPASSEVLQEYFNNFSNKASKLTGTGFAFLVIVALMLMANIDRAINTIWRVKRKRNALSKFIVYWSILSLGPVLIGLSMVVTSYLVSLPLISDVEQNLGLGNTLFKLMPMFASMAAFTLLYAIVPNTRVPLSHAFAGGFLAALLFELAKKGFALYITQFPTYEAIYGTLAIIPIFLVWVYLSWSITLLGAEFAYCLAIFKDQSWSEEKRPGATLLLALKMLERLWLAQQQGISLSTPQISRQLQGISEERLESLLWDLHGARFVIRTEEGNWALARDLSSVTLWDLYQVRTFSLPATQTLRQLPLINCESLNRLVQQLEQQLTRDLSIPLDRLYREDTSNQS